MLTSFVFDWVVIVLLVPSSCTQNIFFLAQRYRINIKLDVFGVRNSFGTTWCCNVLKSFSHTYTLFFSICTLNFSSTTLHFSQQQEILYFSRFLNSLIFRRRSSLSSDNIMICTCFKLLYEHSEIKLSSLLDMVFAVRCGVCKCLGFLDWVK